MYKENEYFEHWMRHRKVLHDLFDLIGNEHIHYKPWSGALSLGALAIHIAASSDRFVQGIKKGEFTFSHSSNDFETIEDIKNIVSEYTEKTRSTFKKLSDSDLEQQLDFNGFIASGKIWLSTMIDHEIHHKGQLFTYARLIGIDKLPFFIIQPPKQ
ncbi:DinB family protein [Bacillus sp. USDA818B3_A]|uniref:DinB family protein n=1 Tax=Bacillus sp. USDA818B3_A TaxID=2698834 RepID=UPI001368EC25|nr:DinB family protein [Bacillus sp. USDA818B3_A]